MKIGAKQNWSSNRLVPFLNVDFITLHYTCYSDYVITDIMSAKMTYEMLLSVIVTVFVIAIVAGVKIIELDISSRRSRQHEK